MILAKQEMMSIDPQHPQYCYDLKKLILNFYLKILVLLAADMVIGQILIFKIDSILNLNLINSSLKNIRD